MLINLLILLRKQLSPSSIQSLQCAMVAQKEDATRIRSDTKGGLVILLFKINYSMVVMRVARSYMEDSTIILVPPSIEPLS